VNDPGDWRPPQQVKPKTDWLTIICYLIAAALLYPVGVWLKDLAGL
jgi:hypothetical protein